jgi:rhamnose transport system ATP-binding protein
VITLLRLTGLEKSFAGVQALRGVSFELRAGDVHALVGENGAGKSTLIKLVTGAHQADAGIIEIDGHVLEGNNPTTARKLGVAAIYQQPALFPDLTVAENIAIGLEERGAWRYVNWRHRQQRARELLTRIGAMVDPSAEAGRLSMPDQQLVEIARALGADARILIMDEPTAALSEREVHHLFRLIRQLRNQGVGIIYISHRLDEVFQMADRVTVLRDGYSVGTRPINDVTRAELIRMMVGRQIDAVFPKEVASGGRAVVELRSLGCREAGIKNVSLTVCSGEIVGLAGLVGAGRTELARILFGLTPADTGEIRLHGQRVVVDSPARAISHGIAYVPEDRRQHGVILDLPVAANTSLAILDRIGAFGWLDARRERATATAFVNRLAIKTPSLDAPVGQLSGGNQQKVSLARWLATDPALLILDEPTQGIDVGAKGEIHRLMGDLAARGLAILMISSDLPEVLAMSDRIAVMRAGTVVGFLSREEATQEKLLALALGHSGEEVESA